MPRQIHRSVTGDEIIARRVNEVVDAQRDQFRADDALHIVDEFWIIRLYQRFKAERHVRGYTGEAAECFYEIGPIDVLDDGAEV